MNNSDAFGLLDAFEGEQYIEIDGDTARGAIFGESSNSTITRTLYLSQGQYKLSYYYYPSPHVAAIDQQIEIYLDPKYGSPLKSNLLYVSDTLGGGWIEQSVEFNIVYDDEYLLTFAAGGQAETHSAFLDAITLTRLN